jgi:phosphatidylinositol-3-phosphatase
MASRVTTAVATGTVIAAVAAAGIGIASAFAGESARLGAQRSATVKVEGVPRLGHVFVIVGENTSLGQLTRKRAPYIAGTLKPKSAWLTGYHALANSSSLGNYIEMTSGQSIRCERNNASPVNLNTDKPACRQKVNNVFHQLEHKRIGWKEWNESMPHPCAFYDDGTDWAGDVYSTHHNPAVYYDDIEGKRYVEDFNQAPRKVCRTHVVPMGTTARDDTSAFDRALRTGRVPRFNYIVPNDCENGHDPCGTRNPVGQFDRFVKREVRAIRTSPVCGARCLVIVTWDEQGDATPHNTQIGSIWFGPQVKPGVYRGRWTHASLLRTLEDGFGLARIADARHDAVVGDIWH